MAKTEHERIKENRRSISAIERKLTQLERTLNVIPAQVGYAQPFSVSFATPVTAFAAETANGFVPFEGCDDFFENTTDAEVTKTVTICNEDEHFEMIVDVDGTEVTRIDVGKCKTIVVKIPAGKSLHADKNGKYRPEAT